MYIFLYRTHIRSLFFKVYTDKLVFVSLMILREHIQLFQCIFCFNIQLNNMTNL